MQSHEHLPGGQSHEIHAAPVTPESAPLSPTYISVKATAAQLNVSNPTVYRRFHEGLFPGRKFGRSIKILARFVADLDAEIRSGRQVDVDAFAAQWLSKAQEGAA